MWEKTVPAVLVLLFLLNIPLVAPSLFPNVACLAPDPEPERTGVVSCSERSVSGIDTTDVLAVALDGLPLSPPAVMSREVALPPPCPCKLAVPCWSLVYGTEGASEMREAVGVSETSSNSRRSFRMAEMRFLRRR